MTKGVRSNNLRIDKQVSRYRTSWQVHKPLSISSIASNYTLSYLERYAEKKKHLNHRVNLDGIIIRLDNNFVELCRPGLHEAIPTMVQNLLKCVWGRANGQFANSLVCQTKGSGKKKKTT